MPSLPTPQPRFISEVLKPLSGTIDTRTMAAGSPGLPQAFQWHDERLEIARVDGTWRESGPCTHGSGETYAKKHWFEVTTTSGQSARIYFERQARGKRLERWWLYTLSTPSA